MDTSSLFDRCRQQARRFSADKRGNIAVIFAIALVPIIGFIGAAVDYSRANNARSSMQAALDSTALMIAKDLNSGVIKSEDVKTKAQSYFNALMSNKQATITPVDAVFTPASGQVNPTILVKGAGSIPTDFMKVAGFPKIDFSSSSTTTWGNSKLRVAMALDVTGSMLDDNKLVEMKKAAKKLVDTLKASATSTGDVYISIIPFNEMVNVGPANKSAIWLDWDTDYGSCSRSRYTTKSDCLANNRTWTASGVNSWKGCVTDRTQPYDTTKDAPDSNNPDTLFLAQNYSACPSSLLPMTSAYNSNESDNSSVDTTLKGKINNLVANGATNQSIAMHWAWMMLQPTVPFVTPPKEANKKYTDAIILLSDGINTKSRAGGDGQHHSPETDARQQILCTNIKAPEPDAAKNMLSNARPQIFTIQVNTDGDPESAVLKACADTGNFFPTSSATGIASAFGAIGASLTKLRVAQ